MKRFKITFLSGLLFFSCYLFAQSPGGIVKHSVWLKGNFFSDPDRLALLNFNPAVALEKSDASIKLHDNIESLQRVTIFTVYHDSLTNEEKQVWEMTGEFGDLLLTTNHVSSKSEKTNVVFEKSKPNTSNPKSEAIIHSYSSHNAGWFASNNFEYKESSIRFGKSASSESADGSLKSIAEFILYEKVLNEMEMTKIETYLALKYGITLGKNYLSASGETVWNWDNDNRFSNNIAGISRDDQSSLLQKQSTSCTSSEQLIIGVNKIVQSNSENTGLVNEGDFLIWGDNAENFRLDRNAEVGAGEMMLPEKKWLMKASGNSTKTIATELKIDTRKFLPGNFPKESFFLVINRSGSDNFVKGNCIYITPDSISSDRIASFSNVYWDTDGSGKDAFTFGFKPSMPALMNSNRESTNKKDASNLISFKVYPNPVFDGNYQVAVNLDKPTDVLFQIYDLLGEQIFFQKGTGQNSYLFTGRIDAPPAPYVVRLVTSEADLYRIIVLQ